MPRHLKAARATLLVALVCFIPVFILWKVHVEDITEDWKSLGRVPDFSVALAENQQVFTQYDLKNHLTVFATFGTDCKEGCEAQARDIMAQLASWSRENLTEKNKDIPTPNPVRFIHLTDSGDVVPVKGWEKAIEHGNSDFFIPTTERQTEGAMASLVIVDDDGYYRSLIPFDDSLGLEKAKRELSKLTSRQFLLKYLVHQTLMWERARGKSRPSDEVY